MIDVSEYDVWEGRAGDARPRVYLETGLKLRFRQLMDSESPEAPMSPFARDWAERAVRLRLWHSLYGGLEAPLAEIRAAAVAGDAARVLHLCAEIWALLKKPGDFTPGGPPPFPPPP